MGYARRADLSQLSQGLLLGAADQPQGVYIFASAPEVQEQVFGDEVSAAQYDVCCW
jgi:hypothetical protein